MIKYKFRTKSMSQDYQIHTNQDIFSAAATKRYQRLYRQHDYQRPIPERSVTTFAWIRKRIMENLRPIILDSGCGKGMSSLKLAELYPGHWVIALDQSAHRIRALSRHRPDNLLVVQDDCCDFWRQLAASGLPVVLHTIFYPNPYPKRQQEKRRWYAHPLAEMMLQLSPQMQLRSNWLDYLRHTAIVAGQLGLVTRLVTITPDIEDAMTHFERKYIENEVALFELQVCGAMPFPVSNI